MDTTAELWMSLSFEWWFKFFVTTTMGLLIALVFIVFFAGEPVKIWLLSWWKRKPIIIMAGPRSFQFKIAEFKAGHNQQWEVDDRGMCIQARDNAIMIGPHKTQMMLAATNFPAGASPKEMQGYRYFSPDDMFVEDDAPNYMYAVENDGKMDKAEKPSAEEYQRFEYVKEHLEDSGLSEEDRIQIINEYKYLNQKIDNWNNKRLWVRYPDHGINPHDFVKYQLINTDPKLVAQYGQRKELQAKIDMANWSTPIMQNLHVLIPLILIIAIAYGYMQQHNLGLEGYSANMECQEKYSTLMERFIQQNPTTTTLRMQPSGSLVRPRVESNV